MTKEKQYLKSKLAELLEEKISIMGLDESEELKGGGFGLGHSFDDEPLSIAVYYLHTGIVDNSGIDLSVINEIKELGIIDSIKKQEKELNELKGIT